MRYGNTKPFQIVPVINTVQYSANDAVGALNTIDALGGTFTRGVLKNVTVTDLDNQKAALSLIFFSLLPAATFTNNAAFPNLAAADLLMVIGKVEIAATDYTTFNARAVATKECSTCLWAAYDRTKADTDITKSNPQKVYVAVQTSGTPTYTAVGSLTVTLATLLD